MSEAGVAKTHKVNLHNLIGGLQEARKQAESLAERALGAVPQEAAAGTEPVEPDTLQCKLTWFDRELQQLGQALARLEDVA